MRHLGGKRGRRVCRTSHFGSLVDRWRNASRFGGVATEFAYVAPFLIALSYGIFEVAHYIFIELVVENSLQDGLHYANVNNSDTDNAVAQSDVQTYVDNEIAGYGISCSLCASVTEPSNVPGNGDTVAISITITYAPLMPGVRSIPYVGQIFQLNKTISVSGTETLTPGGIS